MSRRKGKDRGSALKSQTGSAVTVTVCRGCCCGSESKHPDVDHDAQLRTLRSQVEPAVRVRVSECLDACERSNVMVVTPSAEGRRAGARPVWLGGMLDDECASDVAEWANTGGPGVSEPPNVLDLYEFTASNRARRSASG